MAEQKSKQKKAKQGKGAKPEIHNGIEAVSVASHPRTAYYVRRAKGWGGLGGFAIAGLLSLKASVPVGEALERALIGGVIGFLVCWALAIVVCRQMVIAEMRAIRDQLSKAPEDGQASAPKPARHRRDGNTRPGSTGSGSRSGDRAGAGRR